MHSEVSSKNQISVTIESSEHKNKNKQVLLTDTD